MANARSRYDGVVAGARHLVIATGGDKARDLTTIAAGYALAAAVGLVCLKLLGQHPLLSLLIADVVATAVIFGASVTYRNSSWYDPYWSVAPPLIALWYLSLDGSPNPVRAALVVTLVAVWSVRLTANWAIGWSGMGQQDWRYVELEAASGIFWWPLSFLGIHLFPTLMVFLGCLGLYPALVIGDLPLGWLDAVAFGVGSAAVWLEFAADRQLHRFRARRASRSELLDTGLWRRCRHPNYLGEIGFWFSVFLFGWAALGYVYPWSWLGPSAMLALFVGVSIPMIERRLAADKPGYAAYRATTHALLPLGRSRRR